MSLLRLQRRMPPSTRDIRGASGFPSTTVWLLVMVVLSSIALSGCASYTERMRESQQAFANGQVEQAIGHINAELEVEEPDEEPTHLADENTLFLLERATMLQALGQYESASRDMIHVDDRLEWVDIQSDRSDTVMQFIYSDDAGAYNAPAHERLLLNSMNMINFLAQGDGNSARVEARRLDVLQRYFLDDQSAEILYDVLGLGNYLAGVAFEADDQYRSAARFYTAAYLYGTWPDDERRLLDLLAMTGYRGAGLGELPDAAHKLFERVEAADESVRRADYQERYQQGDTLIIVQTGLVPYLEAERVGLEDALDRSQRSPYASGHVDDDTNEKALALYTAGSLNWINTTKLSNEGLPPARSVTLSAADHKMELTEPLDLASQAAASWEMVSGTAMAAAISRAVTRLAAGKGAEAIVEAASGSSALGWLTGAITSTALAARDTPDTRSWTTLPADIHLVRMQLPEGSQRVSVDINGQRDNHDVEIRPDTFQLLNFSRIR